MRSSFLSLSFALTAAVSLVSSPAMAEKIGITGAGASFPAPIYTKWFDVYNKANPNVEINYQSIGSGGGIKNLISKTVDFGASDAPMTADELKKAGTPVLHVPTVLGAVVVTYNVPGVKQSIKLTPDIVADIFMGKIINWNDARLAAANKGVKFPDKPIAVAYRSDSSGTTAVFTEYLAKVSSGWKSSIGEGKAIKWPVGIGGKGNEGVTGFVKNTEGAIGYVEFTYAQAEKLPVAQVQNKAGEFVSPSVASISEAAAGALKTMPEDFRVSITNPEGKKAYPISAFTYILVYQTMDKTKGGELKKFLEWAIGKGQDMASQADYAPLPKAMLPKVKEKVGSIALQ